MPSWRIGSDGAVLLFFSASWCGPCQAVAAMLRVIAPRYCDRVELVSIDIERHPDLKETFNVRGVPTLLLRKGDGTVVGPIAPERVTVLAVLDEHLRPAMSGTELGGESTCPRPIAFYGDARLKAAIVEKAHSGEFGLMAGDAAEDIAREHEQISGIPAPLLLAAAVINGQESARRARALRWLHGLEPGADLSLATSRLYQWMLRDLLRPPSLLPRRTAPPGLVKAMQGLAELHGLEGRAGVQVDRGRWGRARTLLDEISARDSIDLKWRTIARAAGGLAGPAHSLGDALRAEVAGSVMMPFVGERMSALWNAELANIEVLRRAFEEFRNADPGLSREEAWRSTPGNRYATEVLRFAPKQEAIQREVIELFRKRWHYGLVKITLEMKASMRVA